MGDDATEPVIKAYNAKNVMLQKRPFDVPQDKMAGLKSSLIANLTPRALVPGASINAVLIVGSGRTRKDCDFRLEKYLIVAGMIGTAIMIMGGLVRHVVKWVVDDKRVSTKEKMVLVFLKSFGMLLMIAEFGILVATTFQVYSTLPFVTHSKAAQAAHSGLIYCDYSMYTFSLYFVSMIWGCFTFGAVCGVVIYTTNLADDEEVSLKTPTVAAALPKPPPMSLFVAALSHFVDETLNIKESNELQDWI